MSTELQVAKGSALAKPSRQVKELATRIERARQRFNERLARAESAYYDDVRSAVLGEAEPSAPAPATESAA